MSDTTADSAGADDVAELRRSMGRGEDLLDQLLRAGLTCRHVAGGSAFATCGSCECGPRGPRAVDRNRVCRGVTYLADVQARIARLEGRHDLAQEIVEDMGLSSEGRP